MTTTELGRLVGAGTVLPSSLVWNPALPNWAAVTTIPELQRFVPAALPPPPANMPPPPPPPPPAPLPPPPPPAPVASPYTVVLAEAEYALATLGIHESNARASGQAATAASWSTYSAYLQGLVDTLSGPAAAPSVETELRTGIAQVPPRP